MKKYIISLLVIAASALMVSCEEEALNEQSVITVDQVDYTPFDYWLDANFVNTYNLQFKYRYEEVEADYNYYTIPADYNQTIKLAHLLKYLCLEAYDEAAGIEFTRAYFPKLIVCIGEWEYKNNGTFILGTAEGGRKIMLAGVNYLNQYINNAAMLNNYYFKTIHHEFTHILNQTKPMPTDYQFITGDTYVGGEWSNAPYNAGYLSRGYISSYSQESYTEDFAEMMSMYVCYSDEQWAAWMKEAGTAGAELINAKLSLVKSYMKESFNINLDDLHEAIQRRQSDVAAGKIDVTDLTVK